MARCLVRVQALGSLIAMLLVAQAARAGEMEVEKFKQALQSPKEATRVEAIRKLKVTKAEAGKITEVLTGLLTDKNPEVRVSALDALSHIGPAARSALPTLHKLMRDPQPEVRTAVVRFLARSIPAGPDAKDFLEPLFLALSDKDWQTRRTASSVLSKTGPASVAGLVEIVESNTVPSARAEAILALGNIGQGAKQAVKPLIAVLRDPKYQHLHIQALAALSKMNPEAGVALFGLLDDRDSDVRVTAINSLTEEQARTAKNELVKMLRDPSGEVRWASARALVRSGANLADIEPLLMDAKAEVRAAALQVIGPSASVATLSKFLRDDDTVVNQASAVLLAQRGADAFPALTDALRSKNFRTERAACKAIEWMTDRADDLIPVLAEVLLARETQAPEAVAQAILRVNPVYGARELASKARLPELTRLTKKAGLLEKEHADVQEVVCLALAEQGAAAKDALPVLTDFLKNPRTEIGVLAASARAINSIESRDGASQLAPDLINRIVQGTHEKARLLRDEALNDVLRVGLKPETFEAITTMLSLNAGTQEANEWIIHHSNATNSWNLAGPNLVRVLALFQGRSKHGPGRLTPAAEEALKAHLWRYLQQPLPGKGLGLKPRPLTEVNAVLPIDQLPWTMSAYLALDILKDDPDYKDRKIQGRPLPEYFQEWTIWWREWARQRAMNGLWSEMGFTTHQSFIWPNLLNMVDLASDPLVKQRFRMLLDLTMIEEEQISIQGTRVARRGKKNEVGSNLDPWKDLLFGEYPRRFTDANINYRGIYWTTAYQLPTAAILLRKLNRPVSHYAIANHHFYGGAIFAFASPHYVLGCQFSQPKNTTEFPGSWHRLVFDDLNAILFPLAQGGRHHVQHKNVYIACLGNGDGPAVEFTAALKSVEKNGWIFVSNGRAFAGIYVAGGYQLERSNRKTLGRQTCDAVFPKAPKAMILLHAGDVQNFDSFEKFQGVLLNAPLKITEESLHYMGPNVPVIELFRDPARSSLIAGKPQPFRSETKQYDSPYLRGEVGQPRITVSVGEYHAVYDFENSTVTVKKPAG